MALAQRLKHDTRSVHQRLERGLPLLKDSFTRNDYILLLRKFYGFYVPFERNILRSEFSALLQGKRKVPALREDFEALGVDLCAAGGVSYASLEAFTAAEECWGALYVMEGSTLGGQIISRHLSRKFGLSRDNGLRFFSAYGTATARRWKTFLSAMERAHGRGDLDEGRTVRAAVSTFQTLETWLVLNDR